MINLNGNVGYTVEETCAIIGLYIHTFKGVKVRVAPSNGDKEKELFEEAATVALAWYEEVNGI